MTDNEGWNSEKLVQHYQRTADITMPGRREILAKVAELVAAFTSQQPRILDLGCGSGDVSAEIIRLKPDSSVCMVDFSKEMIKLVQDRFQENSNIEIIQWDLNKGVPKNLLSQKFDIVTSCFAIHHVEFENRISLYTQIRKVLHDSGIFINGDLFTGESPAVTEWESNNLIEWIRIQAKDRLGLERTFNQVKQKHIELWDAQGDKPGTVWEMYQDLNDAGFQFVDCIWMNYNLGIIVASIT
ncbi:MAG: class I SAM-dependent methyltransferase [Dehalococcoidales bacterium]|nr:MAG: class I SAM-dependent methyltransferase [Dehalococcoidales bacterium]